MIYFLRHPATRLIKIGRSRVFRCRYNQLSFEAGIALEVLGIYDLDCGDPQYRGEDHEIEHKLHLAFKATRRHGEWFEGSDALIEFIAAHARPWTPADDAIPGSLTSGIDSDLWEAAKGLAETRGVATSRLVSDLLRPIISGLVDSARVEELARQKAARDARRAKRLAREAMRMRTDMGPG